MTTKIKESNKSLRVVLNMCPRLILRLLHTFNLNLVILTVKAHNFLTDRGGTTVCLLMGEIEHELAG